MSLDAQVLDAIDPGIHATGRATFIHKRLAGVELVRADTLDAACRLAAPRAGLRGSLVIELPQVYRVSKQKGDPNDLISLAAVAGAYAAGPNEGVTFVTPARWKGQAPKDVIRQRVIGALSAIERAILIEQTRGLGKLDHNVYDAVGIGLWKLGRLGR